MKTEKNERDASGRVHFYAPLDAKLFENKKDKGNERGKALSMPRGLYALPAFTHTHVLPVSSNPRTHA